MRHLCGDTSGGGIGHLLNIVLGTASGHHRDSSDMAVILWSSVSYPRLVVTWQ